MKTWNSLIIGVCFGAFAQMSYAIPMLTTANGKVTGATGLESGGMTFSMEFVEGSCVSLFDGCDSNADFLVANAGVTHGSLLDLFYNAFIAGPAKSPLDDNPQDTFGCDEPLYTVCLTLSPTSVLAPGSFEAAFIQNEDAFLDAGDGFGFAASNEPTADTGNNDVRNFARFTLTPAAVPTPGSLALLALGLTGMGLRRKCKTT